MILIYIHAIAHYSSFISYKKNFTKKSTSAHSSFHNLKKLTSFKSQMYYLSNANYSKSTAGTRFVILRSLFRTLALTPLNTRGGLSKLMRGARFKSLMYSVRVPRPKSPLNSFFKVDNNVSTIRSLLPKYKGKKKSLSTFLSHKTYSTSRKLTAPSGSVAELRQTIPTRSTFAAALPLKLSIMNPGLAFESKPLYVSYKLSLSSHSAQLKSTLKKVIFSFLKPNQVKKTIMQRRHRISSFRFLSQIKFVDSSSRYLLSNYTKYSLTKYSLAKVTKHSKLNSVIATKSLYYANFAKKYPADVHTHSEVLLSRIRFKPGYQRLWRNSRLTLAESLNVRYTYQQQFTKYISRFNRKLNSYYFSQHDYSLHKVVLYSKLLPDYKTFDYL